MYITVFVLTVRLPDFKKFDLFYSIALFQTQVAKFAEDCVCDCPTCRDENGCL